MRLLFKEDFSTIVAKHNGKCFLKLQPVFVYMGVDKPVNVRSRSRLLKIRINWFNCP